MQKKILHNTFLTVEEFGKEDFRLCVSLRGRPVFAPLPSSPGYWHTVPFWTAGYWEYWCCLLCQKKQNKKTLDTWFHIWCVIIADIDDYNYTRQITVEDYNYVRSLASNPRIIQQDELGISKHMTGYETSMRIVLKTGNRKMYSVLQSWAIIQYKSEGAWHSCILWGGKTQLWWSVVDSGWIMYC